MTEQQPTTVWRHGIVELAPLGIILICYVIYLSFYFVPLFWDDDPFGYFGSAALLHDTGALHHVPADDFEWVGNMWVVNEDGECFSKYPPFFPALASGVMAVFGKTGALLLNPFFALISIIGIYCLGRLFGLGSWSIVPALLLATNPIFNYWVIRHVAHTASVGIPLIGYVALFAAVNGRPSRTRLLLLFISGAALGFATGVRYTNLLLALPLLIVVVRLWRTDQRPGAVCAVSGLVMMGAILAAYHWRAFGSPLTTGYGLSGEQSAFGLTNFIENARRYGSPLLEIGLGPLLVFALLGFLLRLRENRKEGLLYLSWFIPTLLLMLAYYGGVVAQPQTYLRFLLPTFVPLFILTAIGLRRVMETDLFREKWRLGAIAGVLVVQAFWGGWLTVEYAEPWRQRSLIQQQTIKRIEEASIPKGSVIFTDLPLLNPLEYRGGYHLYDAALLKRFTLEQMIDTKSGPLSRWIPVARAKLVQERLLDVPVGTYRARIDELIDSHLKQGREVVVIQPRSEALQLQRINNRRWVIRTTGKLTAPTVEFLFTSPIREDSQLTEFERAEVEFHIMRISKLINK